MDRYSLKNWSCGTTSDKIIHDYILENVKNRLQTEQYLRIALFKIELIIWKYVAYIFFCFFFQQIKTLGDFSFFNFRG